MYPRLLELGPFTLPTYGAFAALALIAGLMLAMRAAVRLSLPAGEIWNLGLISIASAVFGARILLLLVHWRLFLAFPWLMLSVSLPRTVDSILMQLGLGLFAALLYMTWKHLPWRRTLDAAAPAWALGQTLLALGCFFAGCKYGRPTRMPWGVTFHSRWALLWNGTPLDVGLHPVQLYCSLVQLALCVGLMAWLPHRKQDGELAGAWLLLSGLAQFFLEFLMGDPGPLILHGALSLMQGIAFTMVIAGALLLLQCKSVQATRKVESR